MYLYNCLFLQLADFASGSMMCVVGILMALHERFTSVSLQLILYFCCAVCFITFVIVQQVIVLIEHDKVNWRVCDIRLMNYAHLINSILSCIFDGFFDYIF